MFKFAADTTTAKEDEVLATLCTMFENRDPTQILRVIKRNDADFSRCLDELLVMSDSDDHDSDYEEIPEIIIPEEEDIAYPRFLHRQSPDPLVKASKFERNRAKQIKKEEKKALRMKAKQSRKNRFLPLVESDLAAELINAPRKTDVVPVAQTVIVEEPVEEKKVEEPVKEQSTTFDEKYYIEREELLLQRILKCEFEISRLHTENTRLRESKDLISEENARLSQENNTLAEMNVQIEEEKRNAMAYFIKQAGDLRAQILKQDEEAANLRNSVHELELMLEESKRHESKLSKMLVQSKEILVEGVSTLSKTMSTGWNKIQTGVSADHDFKVLERLKEFAFTIRDEIMKALNINPNQRRITQVPLETLDAFEEEQEQEAKIASLHSYVTGEVAREDI